jgi:hypothetical protein
MSCLKTQNQSMAEAKTQTQICFITVKQNKYSPHFFSID